MTRQMSQVSIQRHGTKAVYTDARAAMLSQVHWDSLI